jgi:hypothetical protein
MRTSISPSPPEECATNAAPRAQCTYRQQLLELRPRSALFPSDAMQISCELANDAEQDRRRKAQSDGGASPLRIVDNSKKI